MMKDLARKIPVKDYEDTVYKRQFDLLLTTMQSNNETLEKEILDVGLDMSNIYDTGRIPMDREIIKSIKVRFICW